MDNHGQDRLIDVIDSHPLFRSLARYACIEQQSGITRLDIDAVAVRTRLDGECDHLSESHPNQMTCNCEPDLIAS